ncbi:hypothetical protein [Lactococcus sp. NH2-7C]|uniref:hypothetical protein n=1 Tax=Lactococcus sp. NH2-7C TaxID=2879149 RepID=UPI001CDD58F8|nr:hypothetical protein [Lactococcus sp. NH2-7C]MCA2390130.1 hypothetical protein [Lactococcus sp. NH2-7C]WGV29610.1 hypothetical protein QJV49_08720 [Lactococcus sp. NH2-7C]
MKKKLYLALLFLILVFIVWIFVIGKLLGLSLGILAFNGLVFTIFAYYISILINGIRLLKKGGNELVNEFFSDLKKFQNKYFK